tara:strand:+ start:363 stop:608 length:246 start_codon:yes stop_codon:yes gene_type:complete
MKWSFRKKNMSLIDQLDAGYAEIDKQYKIDCKLFDQETADKLKECREAVLEGQIIPMIEYRKTMDNVNKNIKEAKCKITFN